LHDVVRSLRGTWITPFDRHDIQTLISRQDDVLDLIHAGSKRVALFEIRETPNDALAMTRYILKAAETIKSAVNLINNLKQTEEILKLCETSTRSRTTGTSCTVGPLPAVQTGTTRSRS